jgi:hypothetical protein
MRVLDRAGLDKQDVRHMTDAEFSELGVRLVNRTDLVLRCDQCGETWAPQLDSAGKLPFDYWVCPARCNRAGKARKTGRSYKRLCVYDANWKRSISNSA